MRLVLATFFDPMLGQQVVWATDEADAERRVAAIRQQLDIVDDEPPELLVVAVPTHKPAFVAWLNSHALTRAGQSLLKGVADG